jgi:tetratricopeptide (TPR) repeat protein
MPNGAAGAEIDNLRAAHDWAFGPDGDPALGCALLAASRATWFGSGQVKEGMERCLRAPAVPVSPDVEAQLNLTIALLGGNLTARADCFEAAQRAADLFGELGDSMSQAGALVNRVVIGSRRGMTAEAGEALDKAARLVRPEWAPRLRGALANARLNYLLMVDDLSGALAAAWQQHECSLEAPGFVEFQANALTNVANCEAVVGRYDSAVERLESVLTQEKRLGLTLGNLARALAYRNGPGDFERALAYGREAWPLLLRRQRPTWLLHAMGIAHARRGAPDVAARVIGHVHAARAQDGEVDPPARQRILGAVLEELRARHGQSQVDAWCAVGAGLNDDEAASLAFGSATSDPRPPVA